MRLLTRTLLWTQDPPPDFTPRERPTAPAPVWVTWPVASLQPPAPDGAWIPTPTKRRPGPGSTPHPALRTLSPSAGASPAAHPISPSHGRLRRVTSHTCKMAAAGTAPAPAGPLSFVQSRSCALRPRRMGTAALAGPTGQLGRRAEVGGRDGPTRACARGRAQFPGLRCGAPAPLRSLSGQSAGPNRSSSPAMRTPLEGGGRLRRGPWVSGGKSAFLGTWARIGSAPGRRRARARQSP